MTTDLLLHESFLCGAKLRTKGDAVRAVVGESTTAHEEDAATVAARPFREHGSEAGAEGSHIDLAPRHDFLGLHSRGVWSGVALID